METRITLGEEDYTRIWAMALHLMAGNPKPHNSWDEAIAAATMNYVSFHTMLTVEGMKFSARGGSSTIRRVERPDGKADYDVVLTSNLPEM